MLGGLPHPGRLYRRSRHPCETKISSSALPQAGPVRSSERQEQHRPLVHGPKPYERRGDAIRADEVERIRIWRGFLIGAKNTLHIRPAKTARTRPLARSRRRWIRDLGRATPSLSHAPSDAFPSRLARPQPSTVRVRRPSRSAACFPAGPAAPRSAAATRRRAYGIPRGCGRARPDPCTPRCGRTC